MERTWTITELAEQATAILAAGSPVSADQVNGRVRDLPNERLIRWYTTIGLVDPPLARRGRTARYGRRHLLQLVAVKRRQADGLTIAGIQAELAGVPDSTLLEIARLPEAVPDPDATTAHRERFWTVPPAEPSPVESIPTVVHGVRLAPGVTLLLDGNASPEADDLAALARAARPVLEELRRRGLLTVPPVPADQFVHEITPGSST
jgi:DNA-binding transcriptional MerR regulator